MTGRAISDALRRIGAVGLILGLAACGGGLSFSGGDARTAARTAPAAPVAPYATPSARSLSLIDYYDRVQRNSLAQDLLRTGGGGVDTPYTADDLTRNFEQLAFYNEFAVGQGMSRPDKAPTALIKWMGPVRIATEFSPQVTGLQRAHDTKEIAAYANRLSRITDHPIKVSDRNPNFHVIVAGIDDQENTIRRFREIEPNMGEATINLVRNLRRKTTCFVITFANPQSDVVIHKAIVLIRAELPELMRKSCIHEELAQGLGLRNDSARARPSIFNDDQEFALLTTHDETLLRVLYNPGLPPGITVDEARPVFTRLLASEASGL